MGKMLNMASTSSTVLSTPRPAPRVISEKSPIPLLWLDTFVGINLVKIRRGEERRDKEIERGLRLRELVIGLVKDGKLLCPMADQEEEYEAERLDSEVFAEFSRLSLGARMNHKLTILDAQIYRAMDAFCRGTEEIVLPWRICFHEDPFRAMEREKDRRVIICVTTPRDSQIVHLRRDAKKDIIGHTERLRRELTAKGRSYEDQLRAESRALGDTMVRMLRDFYSKLMGGSIDFWGAMGVSGFCEYIRHWKNLGGDPKSLHSFLISDYTTSLPIIEIGAQLFADLVTRNQPIISGDSTDVEQLSGAIPLAQFVLTDRKMENRVKRLRIDQKWGTKVFSMSTVDGLFAELAALQ